MEYSLHRQLKEIYAGEDARTEVKLGKWRIDAVVDDELIEIQLASLSAIRGKIVALTHEHVVRVVKPIMADKLLVKRRRKNGKVAERRRSPKRGKMLDVFDELIYFRGVFPHPNLTLDLALVDVEEWRYPGQGRRRRRRGRDHQVEDQVLVAIHDTCELSTPADLISLLPDDLPMVFDTSELAVAAGIARFRAQRIAYCLRHMQAATIVGKRGRSQLYRLDHKRRAASA
jgi:hypothetical protein